MVKNLEFNLIKGKSPTVVLLHGWGLSKESFDDVIQNLNPEHQILTLDFFGFGKSCEPYEYFDTYEYAYSIFLLLSKLNIDDIILVGHSFGGRVSVILSSVFKINIKHLILTSSAGINKFSLIKWLKIKRYKIIKWLNSNFKVFKFNLQKSGSDDYKKLSPLMKKVFIKIVNQDLKFLAKTIRIKTYLVWDKKDNITPYYICKKYNALICQSKIILYNTGNHFVFMKNYHKFSNLINGIIDRVNDNNLVINDTNII